MSHDDLKQRIAAAKREATGEPDPANVSNTATGGLGHGMRVGIELVSAIGVGTFVGWLFDQWLGTIPLFMIIMFIVGAAAGFLNIYRMVQRQEQLAAEERAQRAAEAATDDKPGTANH